MQDIIVFVIQRNHRYDSIIIETAEFQNLIHPGL